MKQKKKSRFGANVVSDVHRRQKSDGYGYLNLPKDLKLFKEEVGRVKLDIIPYIVSNDLHPDANPDIVDSAHKGNPWYKRPVWVHHNIGIENDTLVCLKSIRKKCPICEQRDKQFREGMDASDVTPKAQLRNLYVVIPLGHKDYEEEMHIWEISNGNFQKELDDELAEDPSMGIFPDPEQGKTLSIRFSEESFNKNKYAAASRIDFKDREGYDEDIMEEAPNLDDIFTVLTYKDLEMRFMEIEEEDIQKDDVDKEEEVTSPRRSFRKRKTAEPEDTTSEDGGGDDDEPEPEKSSVPADELPKERTRKRKTSGKDNGKEKCPYDHKFGKDWDEFEDCDDCGIFDACSAKNEELETAS